MKDSVTEEPTKLVLIRAASLPQRYRRKSYELGFVRDNTNSNITSKPDLIRSTSLSLPHNITKTEAKSIGNIRQIDGKNTLKDEQTAATLTVTDFKMVQLPTCSSQFLSSDSTYCESVCAEDNNKCQEGLRESKTRYTVPVAPPIPEEWAEKLEQSSTQTCTVISDNHNADTANKSGLPTPRIPTPPPSQRSSRFTPPVNDVDSLELELLNFCCRNDLLNGNNDDRDIPDSTEPDSTSYDSYHSYDSSYTGELCSVCYQSFPLTENDLVFCTHCDIHVCKDCMASHLQNTIMEGFIQIRCPGDSCRRVILDREVEEYCAPEQVTIYFKNKVDADNNPRRKTCPGCNKIHSFDDEDKIPKKIKCSGCHLDWCARCHAPWHSAMTCKKYQTDAVGKGKKALKVWAKSTGKDSANARKCPSCKFFIERISGCDHMSCNRCHTDFCYRCGKKHRYAGVLGDHYSRYSFLGCKYNLAPKRPFVRVAVRSSVLIGTVVGAPIAAALVVASGGILLGCSPILVPAYLLAKKCC